MLKESNYGVLLSTMALLNGILEIFGRGGYEEVVSPLITRLSNIAKDSDDYRYYMTPCPWLQIKIMKILQHFPAPSGNDLNNINRILYNNIATQVQVTKNINKNNSDHSILFEAFNLAIHYGDKAS